LRGVRDAARDDPKALIAEMRGFDPTLQEHFAFNMTDPDGDWYWQSIMVDWWMGNLTPEKEVILREFMGWWDGPVDPAIRKFVILKARQLGVTWLAVAVGLWYLLYRPGSNVVCYSHGQDEAKLLIGRAWVMLQSLPLELRGHIEVIFPDKAEIPSEKIVVRHPDGRISTFKALPDTQKAGHGETITFAIMDEVARMKYARGIYAAVNPAVSRGGRLVMISTANGVSNTETGEGNFFHHVWITRKSKRLMAAFLPWNLHPERDEEWYQTEAMALPHMERNQQYPLNPDNAFILSGDLYFDVEALNFYRGEAFGRRPKYRGIFRIEPGQGTFTQIGGGVIAVYEPPRVGAKYAISADSASGRSQDYSAGHVIDLTSGDVVCEIRCKMSLPEYGAQLKLLGRWYTDGKNPAMIIPERAGGWGEALIDQLRGSEFGLKPYANIYLHTKTMSRDRKQSGDYGFPMTSGSRGVVLERLRQWLYERRFPFLSESTVDELSTFIYRESGTSPRAMDGCNDDLVMSLALAVHAFEQLGEKPSEPVVRKKWFKKQSYQPPPTRSI